MHFWALLTRVYLGLLPLQEIFERAIFVIWDDLYTTRTALVLAQPSIILPQLRAKFNSFCKIGLFDHSKCGFLWENLGKCVPFVANLYNFGQNSIFAEVVAVVTKRKKSTQFG